MSPKLQFLAHRHLVRALIVVAVGTSMPVCALAQATPAAARDARPAAAPAGSGNGTAGQRTRIELPAAERQALEAGSGAGRPAAPAPVPTRNELLPDPDDARTAIVDEPSNVIEQVRTSNRITEIRVTPAMTGHTFIMTNREGRQPTSAIESTSGLSLPKFFTFEFGRPAEPSAGTLPPPPPSSQSR